MSFHAVHPPSPTNAPPLVFIVLFVVLGLGVMAFVIFLLIRSVSASQSGKKPPKGAHPMANNHQPNPPVPGAAPDPQQTGTNAGPGNGGPLQPQPTPQVVQMNPAAPGTPSPGFTGNAGAPPKSASPALTGPGYDQAHTPGAPTPLANPGYGTASSGSAPPDLLAQYQSVAQYWKSQADDLEQQLAAATRDGETHKSGGRQAKAERDKAMRERDQLRAERDKAIYDRDQAVHARNQAVRERDQAIRYYNDIKARQDGKRTVEIAEVDPPTYKQEKALHPHTRAFPENGGALLLPGNWRVTGGSVRGRSHLNGKFRDDEFQVYPLGEKNKLTGALIAIADGVGAKELSRKGAYAAVMGAANALRDTQRLETFVDLIRHSVTISDELNMQSVAFMTSVLAAAKESVLVQAQQIRSTPDDLHSTFMAFLVVPRLDGQLFVASAQIGDGALIQRQPVAADPPVKWLFLQEPEFSGIDNRVVPFLRFNPDKWESVVKTALVTPGSTVMGMTDGTVDDMSTRVDEETGNFQGYEDFYAKMRNASLDAPQPGPGMLQFLGYKKRASSDDRTVVCVF